MLPQACKASNAASQMPAKTVFAVRDGVGGV
jgi:hypothetical protein